MPCKVRTLLAGLLLGAETFPSSFPALDAAHEKADILHRDFSDSNVMISPERTGFLNDWDLCRHKDTLRARRKNRTVSDPELFPSYLMLT
jgi:hypothetical protein